MKNNTPSFASSHPEATDKKITIDLSASGEEKQKEILDSIHYAQRIKKAHLPNIHYIGKCLERLGKF